MERSLFEQLTLSAAIPATRRARAVPVSVALHASALAAVLLAPVLTGSGLPLPAGSQEVFACPAALLPPPPPPRGRPPRSIARRPAAAASPATASAAVLPTSSPETLVPAGSEWVDALLPECEGCVPWGVPGSVVGTAPAPLDPAPSPPALRPGSGIDPPVKLHHVAPTYPDLARDARVEGVVVIECRIDTEGLVADARVLRGHPLLDDAALDAVRQWRYRPTLLNGQPVSVIMNVTVRFTLRR